MGSNAIPTRTMIVPLDEVIEARDALTFKASMLRKRADELPRTHHRIARKARERANRLDRIAVETFGKAVRDRPFVPSIHAAEELAEY